MGVKGARQRQDRGIRARLVSMRSSAVRPQAAPSAEVVLRDVSAAAAGSLSRTALGGLETRFALVVRALDEPGQVRVTLGRPAYETVRLSIHPALIHQFWLGELHEPSLILQGGVQVGGDLGAFLRFLRVLPHLSQAYRGEVDAPTPDRPRLAVLKHYGIDSTALPAFVPRVISEHRREDQALVAALVVLGLHPICRRIEIQEIVRTLSTSTDVSAACMGWLRFFGSLITLGSEDEGGRLLISNQRAQYEPGVNPDAE